MYRIVLLNHGDNEWTPENLFVGWTDVGLTGNGIEAAKEAGKILEANDYYFEYAYSSVLKRSLQTLWYALDASDQQWIPWEKTWKLNDRHWGALEGLSFSQVQKEYGDKQVGQWLKSYSIKPPAVDNKDKRFGGNNRIYDSVPADELPHGESLEEVTKRVVQYWLDEISPVVQSEQKVIIAAHEDSLKALIKHLERLPEDKVSSLKIDPGKPLVYELDSSLFHLKHYYLE